MALRRANEGGVANILDYIPKNVTLLPNTSGARNAEEAVRIARLSRQISGSDFVKIEVIHDSKYLLPDNYETAKAVEGLKIIEADRSTGSSRIELTITEGRFHQVKRMFQAVNMSVTFLKRISMGNLHIADDLPTGSYRELTPEEVSALSHTI